MPKLTRGLFAPLFRPLIAKPGDAAAGASMPVPASIVLPAGQWDAPYTASGSATGWPDGNYVFTTLNSTITVVVSGGSYTASGTPV